MTSETIPATEPLPVPSQFSGSFDDMDLPESILTGLRDLGYKRPTHVQLAELHA